MCVTAPLSQALLAIAKRAHVDPEFAEAVVFLAAGAGGPDDPFAAVPGPVRSAARVVDGRRQERRRAEATSLSLDTTEVVALLRSVNDRKGVDRRRSRGQLLGWRSGTRTAHPEWQFDRRRGETFPGLADVLSALRLVAPDPEAADALMRMARDDLGGECLADAFAAGRVHTVVRLIRASADQS